VTFAPDMPYSSSTSDRLAVSTQLPRSTLITFPQLSIVSVIEYLLLLWFPSDWVPTDLLPPASTPGALISHFLDYEFSQQ